MAESQISPGELFKGNRLVKIEHLTRSPKDMFFVFPANEYPKVVKAAIQKSKISSGYKAYLLELVTFLSSTVPDKNVEKMYTGFKKYIDTNEVGKYFGEILGPLYLIKNRKVQNPKAVIFPQRPNYELFDYFIQSGSTYVGYSAKLEGGSSNTLVPRLIAERIDTRKHIHGKDVGVDVILQLANEPIFKGSVTAVGMLVKKNIFPATIKKNPKLQAKFKSIDWKKDAEILENNKNGFLKDQNLSGFNPYMEFLVDHVTPRMRDTPKNVAKFTATNLVYGFIAMYLADVSKEGAFDLTPTVRKLFPDLNIVKMGITNRGVPTFHVIPRGGVEAVTLRSKARWDVIKDKLGVQL